ncbi:MAG: hypothetical protein KTR31_18455 [Myxococcales bacterium]|nr:hypothetical protein [Myxococcales bacterium]
MSGLHTPVVVDVQAPNLADVRVALRCIPGDLFDATEAGVLCERVSVLFENQGAEVQVIEEGGFFEEVVEGEEVEPADLTVRLEGRKVEQATYPLSWVLCAGSFTLLPGVREHTFATDVIVRDAKGFLLATETLEGRLVERFGFGPYFGNWLMDRLARDKDERLTGDGANRDISEDLYAQLSQITFNAKMQAEVLRQDAQADAPAALAPAGAP